MTDKTRILPDDIFAEMARLGSRTYSEIGVPMLLVAEDLSGAEGPGSGQGDPEIAAAFDAAYAQVLEKKGEVKAEDFASIIELIADRTFIDRPFSDVGEA